MAFKFDRKFLPHVTYFYKYVFTKMLNIECYTTWPSFMDITCIVSEIWRGRYNASPSMTTRVKEAQV